VKLTKLPFDWRRLQIFDIKGQRCQSKSNNLFQLNSEKNKQPVSKTWMLCETPLVSLVLMTWKYPKDLGNGSCKKMMLVTFKHSWLELYCWMKWRWNLIISVLEIGSLSNKFVLVMNPNLVMTNMICHMLLDSHPYICIDVETDIGGHHWTSCCVDIVLHHEHQKIYHK